MTLSNEILRLARLADRLATLTGNRDAAAGKTADEIAKAVGDARHTLIQACLGEMRKLRADGFTVRLPVLRQLDDEELVAARVDLTRKGHAARRAKAQAEMDAKKGIRPSRVQPVLPQRDPIVERVREVRRDQEEQTREALKGLAGLNLLAEIPEAAE
jgi:hypothetical protein